MPPAPLLIILVRGYSSIDAVLDEYKGEWAAISGVDEIGTVINQSGYFEEIDIIVTAPSEIQSIREKISESVQAVHSRHSTRHSNRILALAWSMSGANISLKGGERTASCHLTRKCPANSHGSRHPMDEDSRGLSVRGRFGVSIILAPLTRSKSLSNHH